MVVLVVANCIVHAISPISQTRQNLSASILSSFYLSLFLDRAAFDNVGRLVMDDELNKMLSEVGGPCNYDNMIKVSNSSYER
jgi:hypothetical protein